MHWADKIAENIIKKNPEKSEYVCACGISPSGHIHIGNFRDVATSYFVVKALEKRGKRAKLLLSWDEYDRLRKVPKNVNISTDFIGYPYTEIPSPVDTFIGSYAEYFEKEFENSLSKFNIYPKIRYQAQMYKSGTYKDYVTTAMKRRKEIFEILKRFKTQETTEEEKENYYPVSIYCPCCKKDTTNITKYDVNSNIANYKCNCGHENIFNFNEDTHCKLAWKVDWAMRWSYESVDFEPGGQDHATVGGSYDAAKLISKTIFNYDAPIFQGYQFIGIKGNPGKMSGSTGMNLTPKTLLLIYQPEILLWLYARTVPNKAFDFCMDEGILKHYFEFDKAHSAYLNNTIKDNDKSSIEYSLISSSKINTVPFSLLVQLGSIVNFNASMVEIIFKKISSDIGNEYKKEVFAERLSYAKNWVELCAPEQANKLLEYRNWTYYNELSDLEKKEISLLYTYLSGSKYSLEELNKELYEIPKIIYGENNPKIKEKQRHFYENVYRLLINKNKGPRLYLFLFAIDKNSLLKLINFSQDKTQEEIYYENKLIEKNEIEEQNNPKSSRVEFEKNNIQPIKRIVDFDLITNLDMRVGKVIKCTEIRKSEKCLKLDVDFGSKVATVVSSIKDSYDPEDIINKKMMFIINLEPKIMFSIKSEAMLMTLKAKDEKCKIIFIDESVPNGTLII